MQKVPHFKLFVTSVEIIIYGKKFTQNFVHELRNGQKTGNIRRLEDNIKMDLKETECDGVGWTQLTEDLVQWGGGGRFFFFFWSRSCIDK
jgi:hypothetical protein